MPVNLENSSVATGLKKISFHFNFKEGHMCLVSSLGWLGAARGFPGDPAVRDPPANAGDMGVILGPGGSHVVRSN